MGGEIPLAEVMPVVAHPTTSDRASMGPSAGLHLCALSIMLAIAFADDVGPVSDDRRLQIELVKTGNRRAAAVDPGLM